MDEPIPMPGPGSSWQWIALDPWAVRRIAARWPEPWASTFDRRVYQLTERGLWPWLRAVQWVYVLTRDEAARAGIHLAEA